ncbi:MAG: GHMP kinase [Methylocystis sp.]|jgi:D-glycero-alpha-D-manno-heptose-7-phosphate kinase
MLTTRTPLRVSFFGGGTDYPQYFERFPGAVLGAAIDKHIYISALKLEPFIGYNYRLSYRVNEEVSRLDEIQHPVFREVFRHWNVGPGWNFGVLSSLPSRSGLGSSSTFVVGLLKLVAHMRGENWTRYDLAQAAIHVERDLLHENVGIQDQLHASFGGLNRYDFGDNGLTIRPLRLHTDVRDRLNQSMFLVHTGIARYASEIVEDQVRKTAEKKIDQPLHHLYELAFQGTDLLEQQNADVVMRDLGKMLHDGWMTKRALSPNVSTPDIDALYDAALANGALGGKLCGAGGGGFLFVLALPESLPRLAAALGGHTLIPIRIDESGTTLISS